MIKKLLLILLFCSVVLAEDKPYRILNSFNSGELTPLLSAREDLSKYQSGCALMENLFPIPQGGAQKRPGTKYIATAKDSNYPVRLIPFEYSTDQSYVIEMGNGYMRFYTDGAFVGQPYGTEDLSNLSGSLVAQWKLNDNAANKTVVETTGDHNGTSVQNTSTISVADESGTANKAFYFSGDANFVTVADHAEFSFGDSSNDSPFSIAVWVKNDGYKAYDGEVLLPIITKYATTGGNKREWALWTTSGMVGLRLYDEDADKYAAYWSSFDYDAEGDLYGALADGDWHFVVVTYDGRGGSNAAKGIKIYIDWLLSDAAIGAYAPTTQSGYDSMVNTASGVKIGAVDAGAGEGESWNGRINNVAIFNKELSAAEIMALTGGYSATTPYEIESPYNANEPFSVRYVQSADVLFFTHPDYAPRKLSRYGNAMWKLEKVDFHKGPFLDENTTDTTITPDGVTGSITLTASASIFSSDDVNSVWQIIYTDEANEVNGSLTAVDTNSKSVPMQKGRDYYFVTHGTWVGTVALQKSYDEGVNWKDVLVHRLESGGDNVTNSGTEEEDDAIYRVRMIKFTSGACSYDLVALSFDVEGAVEITSYTNGTTVTATVKDELGGTTAAERWSEAAWSAKRGYPKTITFFEDRLYFGGNAYKPDTIWGSVVGDYNNMDAGAEDDDAVVFTLSSRQVNIIQWILGKDKLLIGTSGAEWTLSGGTDEPITPSNIKAEQQSVYGSADLEAELANESILFFQRGARKMRELAYNWELDSYVAPDMTILAKEVAGDGIIDTDFQQIPDSILWCVRSDGELATFSYERKEEITAWSRQITDGYFESIASIHGDPEDEVWVSVKRTIDSNTVRYIEQFQPRDFGSDINDAFFVDCGATYTTDVNIITGLDWLEGESVFVLADGNVLEANSVTHTLFDVNNGTVTLGGVYQKVHIGLPYTVQLKTLPLSWLAQGSTIQGRIKRINGIIARWFESGDFYFGRDLTHKELQSISRMTTDESSSLKTFPPGYNQKGQVWIYQYSPEPLTLLALMLEFMVY